MTPLPVCFGLNPASVKLDAFVPTQVCTKVRMSLKLIGVCSTLKTWLSCEWLIFRTWLNSFHTSLLAWTVDGAQELFTTGAYEWALWLRNLASEILVSKFENDGRGILMTRIRIWIGDWKEVRFRTANEIYFNMNQILRGLLNVLANNHWNLSKRKFWWVSKVMKVWCMLFNQDTCSCQSLWVRSSCDDQNLA